eukprot:2646289-Prymnesium_polylepis.1
MLASLLLSLAAPPFFYYTNTSYDSVDTPVPGVQVRRWAGDSGGAIDAALGLPHMTMLEWSKVGVAYPRQTFWQCTPTTFVVISGNVTVTVGNKTKTLERNDVLWVRAGLAISPFVSTTANARVAAYVAPFSPRFDEAPSQSTEASSYAEASYRFYLNRARNFTGNL